MERITAKVSDLNKKQNAYYIDPLLAKNLDKMRDVVQTDMDWLFLVDGAEGSGKSTIAQQIAKYVDPTFDVSRICFSSGQFTNCVINAAKYQAVIYDEAYKGLNSRATMSKVNRNIVSMFTEVRQKNLFLFVVLPSFFDLDKYVAIWRSRSLIHTEFTDKMKRGRFKFYNSETKKYLYIKGKQFYEYRVVKPNIRGTFTDGYVVDEVEYRKRKLEALKEYDETNEQITDAQEYVKWFATRVNEARTDLGLTQMQIAELLELSTRTFERWVSEHKKIKEKKHNLGGTSPLLTAKPPSSLFNGGEN